MKPTTRQVKETFVMFLLFKMSLIIILFVKGREAAPRTNSEAELKKSYRLRDLVNSLNKDDWQRKGFFTFSSSRTLLSILGR